jgi:hypothetical protein
MLKYPRLTQETSSKNIKKQLSSAFSFFFCCDFRLALPVSSPGRCDGIRFRNPAGASLFDETPLHILHHMASQFSGETKLACFVIFGSV